MDQTIIFDKTYSERLHKYCDILPENTSAKQVLEEWSLYIDTTVDQFGWQAIWKLPRQECERFNITFPTLALVFVDNINSQALLATVKILTVQNGIELPECLSACLFHLWPTEEQDDSVLLNLNATSEALDNLRFFHKYLWRPWDEEDAGKNWFQKNLVPRLKVYYDLKHGVVSKNLRDYYRLQLLESKEKYEKLQRLQNEVQEDDADISNTEISSKLYNLHISTVILRKTLEHFENPIIRDRRFNQKNNKENSKLNFWLVLCLEQKFDYYLEFLQNVKAFSNSGCEFNTANSLQDALDAACPNDTIFVGSGKHVVKSSGRLMEGGKIINANYPKEAIISGTNEHLLFTFKKGEIIFQNISFQLDTTRCGIRVRNGATLKLENCTFQGYKNNNTDLAIDSIISTQQGIVSDTGANLHLQNCQFSFFGTALSLDGGSTTLHNCEIKDVRCALRTQNSAALTLMGCQFSQCVECVVQVEVMDENDDTQDQKICDSISVLERMPDMKLTETVIKNVSAPEVIITRKLQFRPVRDIFSNPAFNTTLNRTLNF